MTVQELINYSLIDLGQIASGETPNTSESADAFVKLNQIISSWSLDGITVYTHQVTQFLLQQNIVAYTLGPGGTWNVSTRPVKIKGATAIQGNFQNGLTVMPMGSFEAAIKNGTGRTDALPSLLGEDSAAPLKNVRVWPPPNQSSSIEVSFWVPLTAFNALTDTVSFPVPGYELALIGELALTLAPGYGRPVTTELAANAQRAKQRIVDVNGLIEMGAPVGAAPAAAA